MDFLVIVCGQSSRAWNFAGNKTLITDAGHVANPVIVCSLLSRRHLATVTQDAKNIRTAGISLVSKWISKGWNLVTFYLSYVMCSHM